MKFASAYIVIAMLAANSAAIPIVAERANGALVGKEVTETATPDSVSTRSKWTSGRRDESNVVTPDTVSTRSKWTSG